MAKAAIVAVVVAAAALLPALAAAGTLIGPVNCPSDSVNVAPGDLNITADVSRTYVLVAPGNYTLVPTTLAGDVTVCVLAVPELTADEVTINQPINAQLHFRVEANATLGLERVTLFGSPRPAVPGGFSPLAGGVQAFYGGTVYANRVRFVRCGFNPDLQRAVSAVGFNTVVNLADASISESPAGGAIATGGGRLVHFGSTSYINNRAISNGAALLVEGGDGGVPSQASFFGGAVVFEDNFIITGTGGAVAVKSAPALGAAGRARLSFGGAGAVATPSVTFRNNGARSLFASCSGGALYTDGGVVSFSGVPAVNFDGNFAPENFGGAVYATWTQTRTQPDVKAEVLFLGCKAVAFRNSFTGTGGGCLAAGQNSIVRVEGAESESLTFSNCTARGESRSLFADEPGLGGAVLVNNGAAVTLAPSTYLVVVGCNATNGGGFAVIRNSTLDLGPSNLTLLADNKAVPKFNNANATVGGGAVYVAGELSAVRFRATNTIVRNNEAVAGATGAYGGGIAVGSPVFGFISAEARGGTVEVLSRTACISGNAATTAGGGVYVGAAAKAAFSDGTNIGSNTPQDAVVAPGGALACPASGTSGGAGSYSINGLVCAKTCVPAGKQTCSCANGGKFSTARCACIVCEPGKDACCNGDGSGFLPFGSSCSVTLSLPTLPHFGGGRKEITCAGACIFGNICKPLPPCSVEIDHASSSAATEEMLGWRK